MAKLTHGQVKEKADEWAALCQKIAKAYRARNAEIHPFQVEYEKATAPILERHEGKLGKLWEQAAEIEREVLGWLNGAGKALVVEGEKAVAANELVVGRRTIDARRFSDAVPHHTAEYWECLTVAIAKAEKMLGKTKVDEIAVKETKLNPTLKLK